VEPVLCVYLSDQDAQLKQMIDEYMTVAANLGLTPKVHHIDSAHNLLIAA